MLSAQSYVFVAAPSYPVLPSSAIPSAKSINFWIMWPWTLQAIIISLTKRFEQCPCAKYPCMLSPIGPCAGLLLLNSRVVSLPSCNSILLYSMIISLRTLEGDFLVFRADIDYDRKHQIGPSSRHRRAADFNVGAKGGCSCANACIYKRPPCQAWLSPACMNPEPCPWAPPVALCHRNSLLHFDSFTFNFRQNS